MRSGDGCGLDLPIAVAVLAAAGALPAGAGRERVFAAGLGLDGQLRPVRSLVPVLRAAAAADGPVTVVAAAGNGRKPAWSPG